jgi:phosphatidylserine synthase 1
MGTQSWVYCAIMFVEGILCLKNGKELFKQMLTANVVSWFLVQAALSILFVLGCMFWHKYIQVRFIIFQSETI